MAELPLALPAPAPRLEREPLPPAPDIPAPVEPAPVFEAVLVRDMGYRPGFGHGLRYAVVVPALFAAMAITGIAMRSLGAEPATPPVIHAGDDASPKLIVDRLPGGGADKTAGAVAALASAPIEDSVPGEPQDTASDAVTALAGGNPVADEIVLRPAVALSYGGATGAPEIHIVRVAQHQTGDATDPAVADGVDAEAPIVADSGAIPAPPADQVADAGPAAMVDQVADAAPVAAAEPAPAEVPQVAATADDPTAASTSSARVRTAVNMRARPSRSGETLQVVPEGAEVELIQCRSWCEIDFEGHRGWVYKRFLETRDL